MAVASSCFRSICEEDFKRLVDLYKQELVQEINEYTTVPYTYIDQVAPSDYKNFIQARNCPLSLPVEDRMSDFVTPFRAVI